MIKIDSEKCIGCGACARDCTRKLIEVKTGKAVMISDNCFSCFHCYCVCPVNAIECLDEDYDGETNVTAKGGRLDPEMLLNAIKSRRSVRRFKKKPVEQDKIEKIIEAARFTPTGGNMQENQFIVIKDNKELTKELIYSLAYAAEHPETAHTEMLPKYTERWKSMKKQYDEEGYDGLFYDAPVVLAITGKSTVDAALAASNAELMIFAQGLGCCYIGFMKEAGNTPQMKAKLGIAEDENIVCTLAIGYAEPNYVRTAPRKKKDVRYF